jgi:cysteine-rich repeat protein
MIGRIRLVLVSTLTVPLSLLIQLILATQAQAWRFDFPTVFPGYQQFAADIAVLPDGGIVAGGHNLSYDGNFVFRGCVARIDGASGGAVWQRVDLNAAPLLIQFVQAVATDSTGDIFVAGRGEDGKRVVAKLSGSDGHEIWWQSATLASTDPWNHSLPWDLEVDSSGDVIVVGPMSSDAQKYAGTDGTPLWTYAPIGTAVLTDVEIDADDNVLVGGKNDETAIVHKVDGGLGTVIWDEDVAPGIGSIVTALVLDGTGDAIVAYQKDGEVAVERLSGVDGSEDWSTPFPDAVSGSLTRNATDVFLAVGEPQPDFVYQVRLASLDPADGSVNWQVNEDFQSYAPEIAISPSGELAVTGIVDGAFTVLGASTADGAELWQRKLKPTEPPPGDYPRNAPYALAFTPAGYFVAAGATGYFHTSDGFHYTTGTVAGFALATGEVGICGNNVLDDGETCEDGNTTSGDCCSATCVADAQDAACNDGEPCTLADHCDDAGQCVSDLDACDGSFKCYQSGTSEAGPEFVAQSVELEETTGSADMDLSKVARLCNPVAVGGGDIADTTLHLECYKGKDPDKRAYPSETVSILNRFGSSILEVGKAKTLCMPTAVNGVPTDTDSDRFKCYKAKGTIGSHTTLDLEDQFELKPTAIAVPSAFCVPAQPTLGAIDEPLRNLVCYKIKTAKVEPKPAKFDGEVVMTQNSLGSEGVFAKKATLLCVPTLLQ